MANATITDYKPTPFERDILAHVAMYRQAFTGYSDSPLISAIRRRALHNLRQHGMLRGYKDEPLEVTPRGRRFIQN